MNSHSTTQRTSNQINNHSLSWSDPSPLVDAMFRLSSLHLDVFNEREAALSKREFNRLFKGMTHLSHAFDHLEVERLNSQTESLA